MTQEAAMDTTKLVKVTAMIPVALLKAAKIAAVREGTTLRVLIIEGLDARRKDGGAK
jgi:hypothetical protein